MSSLKKNLIKYIMMGVSTLLLPSAKMVIQKLIGEPNKRTEALENKSEGRNDPDVPQQTSFPNRG